ncbi:hypothetical protein CONCODRAFT_85727 [Conidiobolus coronatus NRRL 28638]|uniref:LsmAD domain-containing protein n=1 Tax=Conidiobolus coronatus (strain ATCC 28846 / CBS 209.66 / NRRL 28638) TaxID=796925 RepID=A0A137P3Y2_CONC2|nr:hypothetical protein CONCODRAFT_85727 [Conidiobolus coronatus NRRL 28638]|eukprot:KXN69727.1 hypothetical protein CONCODRAFT_85727 [Conidiobolus coronatus NRRL 28638]
MSTGGSVRGAKTNNRGYHHNTNKRGRGNWDKTGGYGRRGGYNTVGHRNNFSPPLSQSSPTNGASPVNSFENVLQQKFQEGLSNLYSSLVIMTYLKVYLASNKTEGQTSLIFTNAKRIQTHTNNSYPSTIPTMTVLEKDLGHISSNDPNSPHYQMGGAGFKTDTDISKGHGPLKERNLQQWVPDTPNDESNPILNWDMNQNNDEVWDQFEANEKMFGVKTNFNEELYTTKLDRSAADFKERELKAQRLADEIQKSNTSNIHVAEERGQVGPDQMDEEERTTERKLKGDKRMHKPIEEELMGTFRQFLTTEREKCIQIKTELNKKQKDGKIAELIAFGTNFKLKTPVPKDLQGIINKANGESELKATSNANGGESTKASTKEVKDSSKSQDQAATESDPARAESPSNAKLSAKAAEFKPNPVAKAFVPGHKPKTSSVSTGPEFVINPNVPKGKVSIKSILLASEKFQTTPSLGSVSHHWQLPSTPQKPYTNAPFPMPPTDMTGSPYPGGMPPPFPVPYPVPMYAYAPPQMFGPAPPGMIPPYPYNPNFVYPSPPPNANNANNGPSHGPHSPHGPFMPASPYSPPVPPQGSPRNYPRPQNHEGNHPNYSPNRPPMPPQHPYMPYMPPQGMMRYPPDGVNPNHSPDHHPQHNNNYRPHHHHNQYHHNNNNRHYSPRPHHSHSHPHSHNHPHNHSQLPCQFKHQLCQSG